MHAISTPNVLDEYSSLEEVHCLVNRFRKRTLSKSEWTHRAHLTVGIWYSLRFSEDRALYLLRHRISSFNSAVGTVNSDSSGYHETLTAVWLKLIKLELKAPVVESTELYNRIIESICDSSVPLRYYSRERLFSVEARRGWLEPDLRAFELPLNFEPSI
jgi:hypothetical protein